jgi:hypothetical protein
MKANKGTHHSCSMTERNRIGESKHRNLFEARPSRFVWRIVRPSGDYKLNQRSCERKCLERMGCLGYGVRPPFSLRRVDELHLIFGQPLQDDDKLY